jgi:hypothetical protein
MADHHRPDASLPDPLKPGDIARFRFVLERARAIARKWSPSAVLAAWSSETDCEKPN